jgi:hypothetical protein
MYTFFFPPPPGAPKNKTLELARKAGSKLARKLRPENCLFSGKLHAAEQAEAQSIHNTIHMHKKLAFLRTCQVCISSASNIALLSCLILKIYNDTQLHIYA